MNAGFRSQVAAVVERDLRRERRRGDVVWVTIPFGAMALFLLPLAIGVDTQLLQRIGPGMYWVVVMLFGVLVSVGRASIETNAQRDAVSLLGLDPAAAYVGRSMSAAGLLLVYEIVVGVVAVVLYNIEVIGIPWLALTLVITAVGLGLLGSLAASLVSSSSAGSALVPLLVAPLSVPLLLGATQVYEGLRLGRSILPWMLLMVVVMLVTAIIGVGTARPLQET
jgi:heme exporter protein B